MKLTETGQSGSVKDSLMYKLFIAVFGGFSGLSVFMALFFSSQGHGVAVVFAFAVLAFVFFLVAGVFLYALLRDQKRFDPPPEGAVESDPVDDHVQEMSHILREEVRALGGVDGDASEDAFSEKGRLFSDLLFRYGRECVDVVFSVLDSVSGDISERERARNARDVFLETVLFHVYVTERCMRLEGVEEDKIAVFTESLLDGLFQNMREGPEETAPFAGLSDEEARHFFDDAVRERATFYAGADTSSDAYGVSDAASRAFGSALTSALGASLESGYFSAGAVAGFMTAAPLEAACDELLARVSL